MAEDRNARVAATLSTGAAIGLAIALINSRRVEAGQPVIPDEVIQLIIAIADSSENIKTSTQDILHTLETLGIGQGWPANANSITSLRVAITPITGMQLPSIIIPSGMFLVIKAWPINPGWIQVGATAAESGQINSSWPMLPNEVVWYQVQNADEIFIAATVAGCWACLTVEQRKGGA